MMCFSSLLQRGSKRSSARWSHGIWRVARELTFAGVSRCGEIRDDHDSSAEFRQLYLFMSFPGREVFPIMSSFLGVLHVRGRPPVGDTGVLLFGFQRGLGVGAWTSTFHLVTSTLRLVFTSCRSSGVTLYPVSSCHGMATHLFVIFVCKPLTAVALELLVYAHITFLIFTWPLCGPHALHKRTSRQINALV